MNVPQHPLGDFDDEAEDLDRSEDAWWHSPWNIDSSVSTERIHVDSGSNFGCWPQNNTSRNCKSKSKKYWVRPIDGKRHGGWGRLMDGLTWEGADVFVVSTTDRKSRHKDIPHRAQWSRWEGPRWNESWNHDSRQYDRDLTLGGLWRGGRNAPRPQKLYNFKTRKYESPPEILHNRRDDNLWTDVRWPGGVRREDTHPLSYRDGWGEWYIRVPAAVDESAGAGP